MTENLLNRREPIKLLLN